MRIDLFSHLDGESKQLLSKLVRCLDKLSHDIEVLNGRLENMTAFTDAVDALVLQVEATTSVEQAATVAIQGLLQQLADAIQSGDPTKVNATMSALKEKTDTLAAAIPAGTPAEEPPVA